MCWRALLGKEKQITVSFMLAGHTRCSVSVLWFWYAGTAQNHCGRVYHIQPATGLWLSLDSFLGQRFKRVTGLTQYYHFTFSSYHPGKVMMKKTCDSQDIVTLQLLREPNQPLGADDLPEVLPQAGLTPQRCQYLLDSVATFAHYENTDAFISCLREWRASGMLRWKRRICIEKTLFWCLSAMWISDHFYLPNYARTLFCVPHGSQGPGNINPSKSKIHQKITHQVVFFCLWFHVYACTCTCMFELHLLSFHLSVSQSTGQFQFAVKRWFNFCQSNQSSTHLRTLLVYA